MSIEYQAMFWMRTVCETDFERMQKESGIDESVMAGFKEFSGLLRHIYNDYHSFEVSRALHEPTKIGIMEDDLENYHNLINMLDCLYHLARVGMVQKSGVETCLMIQKASFQKIFKKSAAKLFEQLERYSFYLRYYKNGTEVSAYRQCNTFEVYYDPNPAMMHAIHYFAVNIPETNVKENYAQEKVLFYIADYEGVLSKQSIKRKELSPKRFGIPKLLGEYEQLWSVLLREFDTMALDYDISLNPYVFPCWNFKCIYQKRTLCTFYIGVDKLSVRLPLSYDIAKTLILKRNELPASVCESMEHFGCVRCGNCCEEQNIEIIDGVKLCKLHYSNFVTEDARLIAFSLTTREEADFVVATMKRLMD